MEGAVTWLFLACSGHDESVLQDMLAARSSLEECAGVQVEQLATLCYVEVAATSAGLGDDSTAQSACAAIPEGVWRQECHFRAGEELGRRGDTDLALRHCSVAGDFSRNCLTHTFWGLPLGLDLRSDRPEKVVAAMDEFLVTVDGALAEAGPELRSEARDGLLSRAWFNLYVGTGLADPAAAAAAPSDQRPYALTGWAFEASRLHPEPGVDTLLQTWAEGRVLRGAELPRSSRVGRHARPLFPSSHEGLAAIFIFGGGRRLVDPDPEKDLLVAVLEGLFYNEAEPKIWAAQLADPTLSVRLTAVKNTVLAGGTVESSDPLDQELVRVANKERRTVVKKPRP